LALTWAPYLIIGDCVDETHFCNSTGYFVELAEAVAREWDLHLFLKSFPSVHFLHTCISFRYNFTLLNRREENGDWGIEPKNGSPFDFSGTWGGVMGRVSFNSFLKLNIDVNRTLIMRIELKKIQCLCAKKLKKTLFISNHSFRWSLESFHCQYLSGILNLREAGLWT